MRSMGKGKNADPTPPNLSEKSLQDTEGAQIHSVWSVRDFKDQWHLCSARRRYQILLKRKWASAWTSDAEWDCQDVGEGGEAQMWGALCWLQESVGLQGSGEDFRQRKTLFDFAYLEDCLVTMTWGKTKKVGGCRDQGGQWRPLDKSDQWWWQNQEWGSLFGDSRWGTNMIRLHYLAVIL